MGKIKASSLYLIITEEYGRGRGALEIAKCAIAGGVDIIQLREKNKQASDLIDTARALSNLCKESGVIFIINDDPALAKDVDADGVHLGQEDLKRWSVEKTRGLLGPDKIIGVSTHSLGQFKEANAEENQTERSHSQGLAKHGFPPYRCLDLR